MGSSRSAKLNTLRQGQLRGVVDGHGLPAHVGFPTITAAFAAATGFLFATESAPDFRAARADVYIGNAAIAAARGEK